VIAALLTFLAGFGAYYFAVYYRNPVVLEISTRGTGMVYPPGEVLDFRLYENGRLEYDDYPKQDPPRATMANVVIRRKAATLSPSDVKGLIGLAEQPDFLSAKEEYPYMPRVLTDAWWTRTIKFTHQGREKKIVTVNLEEMLFAAERKSDYPASMVKLLEKAGELKRKATGKDL
jgi:hypothetical protein